MNESNTRTILEAISKALNSGQNDVAVFIVSLTAVIILFIMLALIINSGNKHKIKKSAFSAYQKLVRKFNLTVLETDLLEELARSLLHPEKKYLLLINKGTFRYSVQKLKGLNKEKLELIESLSSKLGFSSGLKLGNVFSTKLFKPGMPVKIEDQEKHVFPAEINSVSENNITIKYKGREYKIKEGEKLTMLACTFEGFKVYSLTVEKAKEGLFSSKHAEPETLTRKAVKFRVIVENEKGFQKESAKTTVISIYEKGAVLRNTTERLRVGDDIKIYLNHDTGRIRHVNAEVVKAPLLGKTATVRFTHIKN